MSPIGRDPNRPATRKQLKYLRQLADQTGTTFTPSTTVAQASGEIHRLKQLLPASRENRDVQRDDARREKREVQDDLATRPDDAVAVKPHETVGYGSNARWRGPHDHRPRVYSHRKGSPTPPAGAVYVGRPTIYGNPFPIGPDGREACVARYEEWLYQPQQADLRERAIDELRGRDLVCWCAPDACHADVLLDLVNDDA
jgi:hypothetical protein